MICHADQINEKNNLRFFSFAHFCFRHWNVQICDKTLPNLFPADWDRFNLPDEFSVWINTATILSSTCGAKDELSEEAGDFLHHKFAESAAQAAPATSLKSHRVYDNDAPFISAQSCSRRLSLFSARNLSMPILFVFVGSDLLLE